MQVQVIYENQDILVINKPAGILAHASLHILKGDKKEETLADWIKKHYPETARVGDNPKERPGMVHRLDKDTSGVMVIARNQKTFDYLKNLFKKSEVEKKYLALVKGEVKNPGEIRKPIGLIHGSTRRSVVMLNKKGVKMKMVKEAVTKYTPIKVLEKDNKTFTLLEIFPKTGRTHQIRVHLASIHHPIVGDKMYGVFENPWNLKRQFLHALSIEFSLPGQSLSDGKKLKLEAGLPKELKNIVE